MPQRSCVCEGTNPNCRYCFGRGFIGDGVRVTSSRYRVKPLPEADYSIRRFDQPKPKPWELRKVRNTLVRKDGLLVPALTRASVPGHKPSETWPVPPPPTRTVTDLEPLLGERLRERLSVLDQRYRCRFCSFSASRDLELARHLLKCKKVPAYLDQHGNPTTPAKSAPSKREATGGPRLGVRVPQHKCSRCGLVLRTRALLDAHVESPECYRRRGIIYVSPEQLAREKRKSAKTSNKRRHPLVACPQCRAIVRRDRLSRHVRKVHRRRGKGRSSLRAGDARAKVSRAFPQTTHQQILGATDDVQSRRMDYTRPYAHPYREHGRFGSHPSHDGFDDQSGPD